MRSIEGQHRNLNVDGMVVISRSLKTFRMICQQNLCRNVLDPPLDRSIWAALEDRLEINDEIDDDMMWNHVNIM